MVTQLVISDSFLSGINPSMIGFRPPSSLSDQTFITLEFYLIVSKGKQLSFFLQCGSISGEMLDLIVKSSNVACPCM